MTEDFKRKLTAILSADVEGYSRLMGEDEDSTVRTLKAYRKLMSSIIERFNGRVVDSPGDNLLAEFESVRDTVQCAVEIQEELRIKNIELPVNQQMKFRIGINLGDVIHDEDRIYGDGINVASRVESLAEGGGICISGTVYDSIKNKLSMNYEFQGEHSVKNIKDPVRVYRVLTDSKPAGKVVEEKKISVGTPVLRNIATVLIIIITGLLVWRFYPKQPEKQVPKTIAVLPFENISSDSEQENFVDGLSEEIINSLTQIPNLGVTGRTSSFTFKNSNKKTQEIANELGVDHVLEGSVRKSGNSLRITAQLIRAADDLHIWSETYDRELKDIFKIQENIASKVAEKLKLTLEAFNILGGTEDVEAYEQYLLALGQRGSRIGDEQEPIRALEAIEKAISIDPNFSLAWALKAFHLLQMYKTKDALNAAQRAIKINPVLADGYLALGRVKFIEGKYFEGGLAYNEALEKTEADNAKSMQYGREGFYQIIGNFKSAYELSEKMIKNDPLHNWWQGYHIYITGLISDIQQAEKVYQNGKELLGEDFFWGDLFITVTRILTKKDISQQDILYSDPYLEILKNNLNSYQKGLDELRQLYESANIENRNALFSINEIESEIDFRRLPAVAAYFGDSEFAMKAIEKSVENNGFSLDQIWFPVFKQIRNLPRFKEFIREKGLVDYWKEFGWPDLCHPIGDDDFECD